MRLAEKALGCEIEILVNNAGVGEGRALEDIPAVNIRHEWEVNLAGSLLLTQGIASTDRTADATQPSNELGL